MTDHPWRDQIAARLDSGVRQRVRYIQNCANQSGKCGSCAMALDGILATLADVDRLLTEARAQAQDDRQELKAFV